MTIQDAVTAIFGAMLAALTGSVSWLISLTLGNRESIVILNQKVSTMEAQMTVMEKDKVTTECVREVIEETLDRRDKQATERREEWDKRLKLEIKNTVAEEVGRLTTRLLRDLHRKPSHDDDVGDQT